MSQYREYTMEPIWNRSAPGLRAQAIELWRRETNLPEGELLERAEQLVVVAKSEETKSIAAVSTAFPYRVPKLDLTCYFFRMYVGKQHRTVGLRTIGVAEEVLFASCELLTKAASRDRAFDVVGIYFQIQNPKLQRSLRRRVEQHRGKSYFYLGLTPDGFEERIHYFD